jgi:hypothetical protein
MVQSIKAFQSQGLAEVLIERCLLRAATIFLLAVLPQFRIVCRVVPLDIILFSGREYKPDVSRPDGAHEYSDRDVGGSPQRPQVPRDNAVASMRQTSEPA